MDGLRYDGLTEDEGAVADHLFEANTLFAERLAEHEDDQREFEYAVHTLQGLLATRVARRLNLEVDDLPPSPGGSEDGL